MTQDRRITDRHPEQPLDWSDTASPASNKAAADLTSLTPERFTDMFHVIATKHGIEKIAVNDGGSDDNLLVLALAETFQLAVDVLASAAPAEEAPTAWIAYYDGVKSQNVARDQSEKADIERVSKIACPTAVLTWEALYTRAAPAAQPDRNAIIEECAQRVESCLAHLTPVEIIGAERHEQSCNVIDHVASAVRVLKSAAPTASQPAIPRANDGEEQYAFEEWACVQKYDMSTHPLHWLFLNERTYAARQGWKAALEYVGKSAATTTSQPDEARDAARYRYLRATTKAIRNDEGTERIECTPDQFDAAIDKGMHRLNMVTCPACNGDYAGVGADGVENDCGKCENGMVAAPTAASPSHPDPEKQQEHVLPPTRGTVSELDEDIVGAVARGWAAPGNSHKVMDTDLALAIAREVMAVLARRFRAQGGEQAPAVTEISSHPVQQQEQGDDDGGALMRCMEAAYPIPDSPHQSVINHAFSVRIAYRKVWDDRAQKGK